MLHLDGESKDKRDSEGNLKTSFKKKSTKKKKTKLKSPLREPEDEAPKNITKHKKHKHRKMVPEDHIETEGEHVKEMAGNTVNDNTVEDHTREIRSNRKMPNILLI